MEMNEVVLTCILSSTLASTVITSIKELAIWRLNRKAKLEDDHTLDEKENDSQEAHLKTIDNKLLESKKARDSILNKLDKIETKMDTLSDSNKFILKDRIKSLSIEYIKAEKVSFEDRMNLHEMWNIYHFGLGGNGDLDPLMHQVDELPLDI